MFKLLGKKSIKLLEYFRMTKCMKEILIIPESVIYLWNSPWIPYLQTVLWFWTYTWPKAFVMLFSWPLSYFHYTSYSWWIPSTPHTYGLCSLSLSVLPAPGPLHLQSGVTFGGRSLTRTRAAFWPSGKFSATWRCVPSGSASTVSPSHMTRVWGQIPPPRPSIWTPPTPPGKSNLISAIFKAVISLHSIPATLMVLNGWPCPARGSKPCMFWLAQRQLCMRAGAFVRFKSVPHNLIPSIKTVSISHCTFWCQA